MHGLAFVSHALVGILLAVASGASGSAGGATGAAIYFVDDDAPPGGDGLSWGTALNHLQDALALIPPGTTAEIRVAQGAYPPDRSAAFPGGTRDRESTFSLRSGVAVRGGFAGIGAKEPALRNISKFLTVLTGDLLADDDAPFLNRTDNAYQVVTAHQTDATAILDGVTIRGGYADGPGFGPTILSRDQGAGLNVYDAAPILLDCTLTDNFAINHGTINDHGDTAVIRCVFRGNRATSHAAGLYSHFHSHTIAMDCLFEDNLTPGQGGGAYNKGSPSVHYSGCIFRGNGADKGAGFYCGPDTVTVFEECSFESNSAQLGAGIYNDGGYPVVTDCWFTGNEAMDGEGGAGIWNEAGAGSVTRCTFAENVAFQGGGIYNRDSNAVISDCAFHDNDAITGGGVWSLRQSPTVLNCLFTGNTALTGGGMYNELSTGLVAGCTFIGNSALDGDGGGGMINAFDSAPTILACTFLENDAQNGVFGGGGGLGNYVTSSRLFGCVFVRNTASLHGGAIYNEADSFGIVPQIVNCRFEGNEAHEGGGMHNFRSNPLVAGCTFSGNVSMTRGGAIMNHFISAPTIANCTMCGNQASEGPAMTNIEGAQPVIRNTIAWGNGETGDPPFSGLPSLVAYSLIEGGHAGEGNVQGNPTFLREPTPGADGAFGSPDDDYGDLRLGDGSPAIDAGLLAALPLDWSDADGDSDTLELLPHDLAGAPRCADAPQSSNVGCGGAVPVDLGAYEAAGAVANPARPSDLDQDGATGASDLSLLIGQWGSCQAICCPADLDGDGDVGMADVLKILAQWSSEG